MGRVSSIEWCDSSLNLQMGCDGCELWSRKKGGTCYAALLVERWKGRDGYPNSFDQPKLFPHRLAPALRWSGLRGTARPDKPWLDGYPRCIFLDDMGDTFTESLPLDWLADHLEAIAHSPHIFQLLTKRPSRMRKFFAQHELPPNVWPMVSITGRASLKRVQELLEIPGASVYGVSYEPIFEYVDLRPYLFRRDHPARRGINWIVLGGESGTSARATDWPRRESQ